MKLSAAEALMLAEGTGMGWALPPAGAQPAGDCGCSEAQMCIGQAQPIVTLPEEKQNG